MNWIKKNYAIVLPCAIIIVAVLAFILLIVTRPTPPVTKSQERVWDVYVEKATKGNFTPNLILYGQIESPTTSILKSALIADVTQVYVKGGNKVSKGQLLLTLDDRDTLLLIKRNQAKINEIVAMINAEKTQYTSNKLALKHQQSMIKILKREARRHATLLKKRLGSEAAFDQALEKLNNERIKLASKQLAVDNFVHKLKTLEAQLETAKANLADANLDLERTKIKAPFVGRVVKVFVAVGNRVIVGSNLIELFDLQDVEVRVQIPSSYLPKIHRALSQKQEIIADAIIDNQRVKLQFLRLAGRVETGRGGRDALFRILGSSERFAIGRSIKLTILLPTLKDVFSIPEQALYGNDLVYIIKNGRMQPVKVTRIASVTNSDGNKRVLVRGKLNVGDLIITTHLPQAISGLRVRAIDSK